MQRLTGKHPLRTIHAKLLCAPATIRLTRDTDKPSDRAMADKLNCECRCAATMASSRLGIASNQSCKVLGLARCAFEISLSLTARSEASACMRKKKASLPRYIC